MPQPIKTIFTMEERIRLEQSLMNEALVYRTAEKNHAQIDSRSGELMNLLRGERFVRELAMRKSASLVDESATHMAGIQFEPLESTLIAIESFKGLRQAAGEEVDIPIAMDPYLEEFWDAYRPLRSVNWWQLSYPDTPQSVNDSLTEAFDQFKNRLKLPSFVKVARSRRTHANSRYNSVIGHYEALMQMTPQLDVIKLGLAYSPESHLFEANDQSSYEGLRNPFNRFMNHHIHQSDSGSVAGYLWKLDRIGRRGYCFHLLIFADPRYAPPLEEFRQQLEDSWLRMKQMHHANDQISKTRGSEFQLASVSDPSRGVMQAVLQSPGTGVTIPSKHDGRLSDDRPEKISQIKQLLTDWVKFDRLMSLGLPPKHRVFGKSQISRKVEE